MKNKDSVYKLIFSILILITFQSCYFVEHFKTNDSDASEQKASSKEVVGQSLGEKAGGINKDALESVYGIKTEIAPTSIRLDPDLYARRLLLQYRNEGTVIANQIARLERYRGLLGGASEDFQTKPQEEYDATSLLTKYTVAEQICEALISPNRRRHEGWDSILPSDASDWETNIKYLAQRLLGKPSSKINEEIITELKEILDGEVENGDYKNSHYISVCVALSLDAEALFL